MTYASVLTLACGPDDEALSVGALPTTYPRLLAIESEYVLARGADTRFLYVERGALGTERAPHAAGVAIARNYPNPQGGGSADPIPIGVIVMWGGLLTAVPVHWQLCDGTNGTPDLRGLFVKGSAAGVNPGVTGGAATHAHTASGAAVANHVFTQAAAHSNHAVTQSANHIVTQPGAHAAHVVTQPANHVFTQPAAHSNHAVTQPSAHADNIAHTHGLQGTGGTTLSTTGAFLATSSAAGGSLRTATGPSLSQGTGASLTHSGTAVDAHSAHSGAAVDAHSATAVDAHSAHSGGAVDAHSGAAVDAHSVHSGAGVDAHAVTQPTLSTVSSEPAYYSLAYIQKVA